MRTASRGDRRSSSRSRSRIASSSSRRRAREPGVHVDARIGSASSSRAAGARPISRAIPGSLLWMMRSQPEGKIVLTAEAVHARALLLVAGRVPHEPRVDCPAKFACALRQKLHGAAACASVRSRPVPRRTRRPGYRRCGSSTTTASTSFARPSRSREDRAISLVLSTDVERRAREHVRAFEQALRTLRPLTDEELGAGRSRPTPAVVDAELADDGGRAGGADGDAGAAPRDVRVSASREDRSGRRRARSSELNGRVRRVGASPPTRAAVDHASRRSARGAAPSLATARRVAVSTTAPTWSQRAATARPRARRAAPSGRCRRSRTRDRAREQ